MPEILEIESISRDRARYVNEMGISVVIPVFNSAESLHILVERLNRVLVGLTEEFEIILVNDGSKDDSWSRILDLSRDNPHLKGIDLIRNFGQQNALLCGIKAASHDVIVTIDDDLQIPPEEIPKVLSKLAEGYDVVYGTPIEEQHGLFRDLASVITKIALQAAAGNEAARNVSAFRAFRTFLRGAFDDYRGSFVSIDVLLTWGATRYAAVEVRHEKREFGKSNYTFRKLLTHALNMMTGFSTLPLQIASVLGFTLTIFGIAILTWVLIRYVTEGMSVPGFPFLASIIAIFSGSQLFCLGIIGEYIARIHFRVMDRPPFAIRRNTSEKSTTGILEE